MNQLTLDQLAEQSPVATQELIRLRAELAKANAKIKAAQEQKPVFMWHKSATQEESEVFDVDCACECCVPLYAAPIPASHAELAYFADLMDRVASILTDGVITVPKGLQTEQEFFDWLKTAEPIPADKPATILDQYDAGYLNDYGGGNVGWRHDYIRSELERAYDFYQDQVGG